MTEAKWLIGWVSDMPKDRRTWRRRAETLGWSSYRQNAGAWTRHCIDQASADENIGKLAGMMPEGSTLRVVTLSEEQFAAMRIFEGGRECA